MIPEIIPNLHVILVHFPMALLTAGVLIEILNFLWHGGSLHKAGRWMILIGTLMMAPVVTSGIYALYDVATHGNSPDNFSDLASASGFTMRNWGLVRQHVLLTGTAAAIATIAVIWYLGASDRARKFVYLPAFTLILLSMGLLVVGAWHGGEMVYRQGFGVDGKLSSSNEGPPPQSQNLLDQLEFSLNPMQIHLVFAGFLFAVAAGAMGVSYRRSTDKARRPLMAAQESTYEQKASDPWSSVPAPHELAPPESSTPPSPRFWVAASLLGIITLALGLYVGGFSVWPKVLDFPQLRDSLMGIALAGQRRIAIHIILGTSILVLCILLAIIGFWAPRQRELLGLASLLLILAVAAQIWIGTLLLFDGDTGPIDHFRTPPAAQEPATQPASQPMQTPMQPTTQTAAVQSPVSVVP